MADSFPFFLSVFNQLAEQHGFKQIEPESASEFRHYTPKQMMEKVAMPAWKLPLVAKSFIGLMRQNAASIKRFEHVNETLAHLANHGVTLAIVTSNSYDNASQILGPENTKLFSQFECGMSIFGKPARIKKVLKKTGIPAAEAIYIGDQITDLEAAHQANVAFGAVSWGYSSIESMRALNPEEEFETVSDLQRIA